MGALMFIHQGGATTVRQRSTRYHLPNTIGNLVDRAVTFASFVFGGVMDQCPDLKVCLAHGGGYTCFGIGRMDRGWQVRSEARAHIDKPPSAYLRKFYYDCLTHSEAALRMVIDSVGADRVVLGTDRPADMRIDWPVSRVLGLQRLTQEEKELALEEPGAVAGNLAAHWTGRTAALICGRKLSHLTDRNLQRIFCHCTPVDRITGSRVPSGAGRC